MSRKRPSTSTGVNDKLRGNNLEHLITKLIRDGWDHRKIAKRFDINKRIVDQVADKIAR